MDWNDIEVEWAAMARRLRADVVDAKHPGRVKPLRQGAPQQTAKPATSDRLPGTTLHGRSVLRLK
ncbi:MAG: hypothetical protein ACKVPY_16385 [Paracoccaceae bacterium]